MNYRVVLREELHQKLVDYLLRHFQVGSLQEEVCFALWYPGDGMNRYTGILHELILPISDDRELHGNITVHLQYLNRVLERALDMNAGVAVLHSHPDCGWQTLSCDDEDTERNLILPFIRETGLPLLGLTLAKNEIWSARFWHEPRLGSAQLTHCTEVRRVGVRKSVADTVSIAYPVYTRRTVLERTLDCWGLSAQARLARTHICVVGVGSVGAMVLEALARTGIEQITIIDQGYVGQHRLDR